MKTKFRGKSIKTGKWVEGFYVKIAERAFIIPLVTEKQADDIMWPMLDYREDFHEHSIIGIIEVYPDSVGMWTGIKDKKGVDVYEGDIVAQVHPDGDHLTPMVIYWREGSCGFHAHTKDYKQYMLDRGIYEDTRLVIGNTTDKPELLEADSK